jgi:hypothetical protein
MVTASVPEATKRPSLIGTLRLTRAALYRSRVAAVVACAATIACERRGPATVTPVDGENEAGGAGARQAEPTMDASQPASTSTATAPPSKMRARGETCASNGECAAGLTCCLTGICGGRAAQAGHCKNTTTCEPPPCPVIPHPPYGCVFPCDDVVSV